MADRIGVCSWSLQPNGPEELVDDLRKLGLKKLQLALDPIREDLEKWRPLKTLLNESSIEIASAQFGAIGEDYSTPQTIRQTGGFVPNAQWEGNLRNIRANMAIAQSMGIRTFSTHAGFIPQDTADPMYDVLVGRIQTIADLIGESLSGDLLLETGQETSSTLRQFLESVDRKNLGVNFDPANMLLYDMGDPVEAVKRLLPHVRQVHIKDATPPSTPGAWGEEVPVGKGAVDWRAFLDTLAAARYRGDWIIEREAGTQRSVDVAAGRKLLLDTFR